MNFFEKQDVARRNSRVLFVLFALAVLAIVAIFDLTAMALWYVFRGWSDDPTDKLPMWVHVAVIGGVGGVILVVSIMKTLEVQKGGGIAVAQLIGARQIVPMKATPLERRLLNIVEEMAIACGTRVPVVYVMEGTSSINAFAAGHDGSTCVIVATRGALERLNRDELQGVIGHEYAHIVNGDMDFNLKMVGVLAGLVFIGAAGAHILNSSVDAKERQVQATPFHFFIGGFLFLVGYVGMFFARMIKAKVAREREHLADMGSVQFTRNPEGLAGALDQVRHGHSFILHPHAEDVAHLFFSDAIHLEEDRMWSTHPRIAERIARLAPHWSVDDYRNRRIDPIAEMDRAMRAAQGSGSVAGAVTQPWSISPGEAAALVGTMQAADVNAARTLLDSLPKAARLALENQQGARALVLAMFFAPDEKEFAREVAAVKAKQLEMLVVAATALIPAVRALPVSWHLAMLDLALAKLRENLEGARRELLPALKAANAADARASVYRFAFLSFVRTHLDPSEQPRAANKSLAALRDEVALMLSFVAHSGCSDAATAAKDFAKAFDAGSKEVAQAGTLNPIDRERLDPSRASQALERLRELDPVAKARLIKSLFAAITADGTIRPVEAALMRMIGATLDCPLPPLVHKLEPMRAAAAQETAKA